MLWKYEPQSHVRQHVMLYRGSGGGDKRNWSSFYLQHKRIWSYFSLIDSFTIKPPRPMKHTPVCSTRALGWRGWQWVRIWTEPGHLVSTPGSSWPAQRGLAPSARVVSQPGVSTGAPEHVEQPGHARPEITFLLGGPASKPVPPCGKRLHDKKSDSMLFTVSGFLI